MAYNKDVLFDAVSTIHEECYSHLDCEDCPLHDPENILQCIFTTYLPYQIKLSQLEKAVEQ